METRHLVAAALVVVGAVIAWWGRRLDARSYVDAEGDEVVEVDGHPAPEPVDGLLPEIDIEDPTVRAVDLTRVWIDPPDRTPL